MLPRKKCPDSIQVLSGHKELHAVQLLDAFDVQAGHNRDKNQVTIHATLTDATPRPPATCSPAPAPTPAPRDHHNQVPQAKITLAI